MMMALETCNASIAHDSEGARNQLDSISVYSYPGEKAMDLTTEAQHLIKIMQGDYALPVNTGSKLIQKVTKTSCEYFNRKMYTLLDEVKTLEHEYKLSDPKTLTKDSKYAKFGPLGVIATLQAAHGALLSELDWPALATKLPEANLSMNTSANTRTCYRCGSGDHLSRNCPQPPAGVSHTRKHSAALADWKYIKPVNLTTTKTDDLGRVWKFCTKCKCRASKKIGFYQLSHLDSAHLDNYRACQRAAATIQPASSVLGTINGPTSHETAPPDTPQSNLSAVANPNPTPASLPDITTPAPSTTTEPLNDMSFTGAWCAPVIHPLDVDVSVCG